VKGGLNNNNPTRGLATLVYISLTQHYEEQILNKNKKGSA
jgi:hypothetical protein